MNAAENEDLNEIADTFKEDELIHFGDAHRPVVVKACHVDEVSNRMNSNQFYNTYFYIIGCRRQQLLLQCQRLAHGQLLQH